MAPITVARVLCGLLFFLGTFALAADTTKSASGQLYKAESKTYPPLSSATSNPSPSLTRTDTTFSTARRLATVSAATPAPLEVRSTRTTTVFSAAAAPATVTPVSTISTTTTTALPPAEPTPAVVVVVVDAPTPAPGEPAPAVVVVVVVEEPTTAPAEPAPAPLLHAAPLPDDLASLNRDNKLVSCYNTGWWETRRFFITAINAFCGALDRESLLSSGTRVPLILYRQHQYNFFSPGRFFMDSHIVVSLEVKPECEWVFDADECGRYLRMPVDMCQTQDVNSKKGGTVQGRTGYGEKEGMSRTCLLWRVDVDAGYQDAKDAEPLPGYVCYAKKCFTSNT